MPFARPPDTLPQEEPCVYANHPDGRPGFSLPQREILDVHRDDADMESIDKMTGADIPSETPGAKDA